MADTPTPEHLTASNGVRYTYTFEAHGAALRHIVRFSDGSAIDLGDTGGPLPPPVVHAMVDKFLLSRRLFLFPRVQRAHGFTRIRWAGYEAAIVMDDGHILPRAVLARKRPIGVKLWDMR